MNNPTLYLVGGIFLILFFCVMTYFFVKTFKVAHVLVLFCTFGLSMWFVAMAAMSHKTKLHWRKQVDRLERDLVTIERERMSFVNNYTEDENGNRPDTIMTARNKLNRIMLDRGRVWRGCTVTGANNLSIQLSTADPAADAATARPNRIEEKTILYAFAEEARGAIKVPKAYLGEFQATAVSPTTVTLTPTDVRLMMASQRNIIQASAANNVTWSLYEIMPIDSHLIYAQDPNADIVLTAIENQAIFGPVDQAVVNELYDPEQMLVDFRINLRSLAQADPATRARMEQSIRARLEAVRNSYLRDGQDSGKTTDPQENVFEKVQFETDFTVEVDGSAGQGALTSNYFDSQGKAVVDRLRRSNLSFLMEGDAEPNGMRNVEFKKGDFAVFNFEKAVELRKNNTVSPIESRFVRTLLDYSFEFRNHLDRRIKIAHDRTILQKEVNALQKAEADAVKQRDYRKNERDKLLVDKAKFVTERDSVATYLTELQTKEREMKAQLSALYRANAAMAAKLAQRSQELSDEIERRTAAAGAEVGGE